MEGGDDGGISGGGGQAGPSSALSDYEQQRLDNIRQNEERLRTLGLLGDPIAPAARPIPAPRQPRPPRRVPAEPSRGSERQRGKAPKSYSEAQGDRDLEALLASDSDDGSSQELDESAANNGESASPRRSSRVPGGDVSRTAFDAAIKGALASGDLEGTGLRLVYFMSATQLPRDRINSVGVTGDADELDRHPESQGILISLKLRNFFSQILKYSPQLLWRWVAWVPGLDVTVLFFGDQIIGAAMGYYWAEEQVYLTHLTAVGRDLQGGGIGRFLRRQQLSQLNERVGAGDGPLEVVSLSATSDADSHGAVGFQRRVFTQTLGFEEVPRAEAVIRRLAAAHPELELDRVLQQAVTPLRFRKVTSLRGV